MFKRGSEGGAPAGKGGPGTQAEEKTDPIPRHIPLNSVTLNFVQRGWTNVAPGRLYYAVGGQTPKYLFDDTNINLFNKFKPLYYTMQLHPHKLKISNLIMLQDDLRVQSNTPTDATAFTQVNYLMQYCPKGMKQYFKLGVGKDATEFKNLTYKLTDATPKSPFIEIKNYQSFDTVNIVPAKANLHAGFIPGSNLSLNNGVVQDVYAAPNTQALPFQKVSGNMAPKDDETTFYKNGNVITRAVNQDKISFYKYGDTIEHTFHNNLEGVHLANTLENRFLEDQIIEIPNPADPKQTLMYATEFAYPSRNRPFFCRSDYYSNNLNAVMQGKKFKPLTHYFYSMPPLTKPDGALLGQRCAIFCEQEMQVTFHFTQGTFGTNDDDELQSHQDDAVIVRRNFYPTPQVKTENAPERSVFCKKDTSQCKVPAPSAAGKKCYKNNFDGFAEFLDDIVITDEFNRLFTFTNSRKSGPNVLPTHWTNKRNPTLLPTPNMIKNNTSFQGIWEALINYDELEWFGFVLVPEKQPGFIPGTENNVYWKNSRNEPLVWQGTDVAETTYIYLNKAKFINYFLSNSTTYCKNSSADKQNADYVKDSFIFFT
uniref:VP4 n=1 Tax=Periparus ater densovirus TaxID=2794503 RepID=A0A8A4XDR9_9VIRU|nr:MAG: VP4 [Periparus ater densovirus]